jgi:hypothetical protein
MFAAAEAHAVTLITFTTFAESGSGRIIAWKKGPGHSLDGSIFSTMAGHTSPGSPLVIFNFQDTTHFLSGIMAKLTLTGTEIGNPATSGAGFEQCCIGGSFSFIYEGPDGVTDPAGNVYHTGVTNLLSGAYTLARITGLGTSGAFHDSTDFGTISYTSDIIPDLSTAPAADFSIALAAIKPALGATPGEALNSFRAGASGAFSAALAIPEPASWAMMITGFGLLGLAARRRRLAAAPS